MKRFLMFAMMIGAILSSYAADYNEKQEALIAGIEKNLKDNGYSVERRDDGLKFISDGDSYFIEVDKDEVKPMFVRLARYVKFDDRLRRPEAMKHLGEYNTLYGIKVFCKEKNIILTGDMFVTSAEQFNYAFTDLLRLMKSAYESIK